MTIMKKVRNYFEDRNKKRNYFVVYTVCFIVTSLLAFSWLIFSDKSLIWHWDAWNQHYKALVYYAQYLREIIRELIHAHKLVIPDYDFYIGEGGDVVNTLHYYVIGDPIALFSVLVPTRYMYIFYSFSCILRMYLSGIAFSALAFGTGHKNRYAVLAGTLSYVFCSWGLYTAARHPYFLNPMIYFPLIVLGVEKIIGKKRPYLFILSVTIAAASNFYFFYIIVILTVVYTLFRLGFLYKKDLKNGILTLFKIGLYAVLGVSVAGIILIPVLMMFLQDSRLSASQPFHLFYPWEYYSAIPAIAVTHKPPYYLCMGFSAPTMIALFTLFVKKKENRFLKTLFGVCAVFVIFPIFGRILNGMGYMTNRWVWVFALLSSYILTKEWDTLLSLPKSDWRKIFICSIVFYAVCMLLERSRTAAALSAVPLFFITLTLISTASSVRKERWKQQALLVLMVGISAVNIGFWRFSPSGDNYISELKENGKIQDEMANNETQIVKELSDVDFPRYSGQYLSSNANMVNDISSTQYYWSLSNPYINSFRAAMEMREPMYQSYIGYDERTALNALSAVQYYVVKSENIAGMPYGYTFVDSKNAREDLVQSSAESLKQELGVDELTEEQLAKIESSLDNTYYVYKNDYALPLGYCYGSYITQDIWESLDPIQKQEVQLEAAFVSEAPDGIGEYSGEITDYHLPFEISCEEAEITQTEDGFVTTVGNASAVLKIEGNEKSETYLRFTGLEFEATPEYELYFGGEDVDPKNLYNKTNWEMLSHDEQISIRKEKRFWNYTSDINITIASSAGSIKTLNYKTEDADFASGRHDYVINLGYIEDPVTSITITFPERGIYRIDNMEVYSVPMQPYAGKIKSLKKNVLRNIKLDTDTITGKVRLDDPQLLCMAVAYSPGWKAYVDGGQAETFAVNERYLGISLPAGEHSVRFVYSMPYKYAGVMLTLAGAFAFLITVIFVERSRKAKRKSSEAERKR